MENNWQKYLAEAIATFAFVFVCTGALLANWQAGGSLGTLGVGLASGLMLTAMIYSVYHISGAHLNPAVTIALWATGHVKTLMAAGYILAQLIGSVVAALFLKVVFSGISPQYFLGIRLSAPALRPEWEF